MTELLRQALAVLGRLPPDRQDDIARALLAYARDGASGDEEPEDIGPGHLAAVLEGMAQAERREFAVGEAGDNVKAALDRARS